MSAFSIKLDGADIAALDASFARLRDRPGVLDEVQRELARRGLRDAFAVVHDCIEERRFDDAWLVMGDCHLRIGVSREFMQPYALLTLRLTMAMRRQLVPLAVAIVDGPALACAPDWSLDPRLILDLLLVADGAGATLDELADAVLLVAQQSGSSVWHTIVHETSRRAFRGDLHGARRLRELAAKLRSDYGSARPRLTGVTTWR